MYVFVFVFLFFFSRQPMETEYQFRPRSKTATSVVLPELDILLHLMVVQYLLDKGTDLLEKVCAYTYV